MSTYECCLYTLPLVTKAQKIVSIIVCSPCHHFYDIFDSVEEITSVTTMFAEAQVDSAEMRSLVEHVVPTMMFIICLFFV